MQARDRSQRLTSWKSIIIFFCEMSLCATIRIQSELDRILTWLSIALLSAFMLMLKSLKLCSLFNIFHQIFIEHLLCANHQGKNINYIVLLQFKSIRWFHGSVHIFSKSRMVILRLFVRQIKQNKNRNSKAVQRWIIWMMYFWWFHNIRLCWFVNFFNCSHICITLMI